MPQTVAVGVGVLYIISAMMAMMSSESFDQAHPTLHTLNHWAWVVCLFGCPLSLVVTEPWEDNRFIVPTPQKGWQCWYLSTNEVYRVRAGQFYRGKKIIQNLYMISNQMVFDWRSVKFVVTLKEELNEANVAAFYTWHMGNPAIRTHLGSADEIVEYIVKGSMRDDLPFSVEIKRNAMTVNVIAPAGVVEASAPMTTT